MFMNTEPSEVLTSIPGFPKVSMRALRSGEVGPSSDRCSERFGKRQINPSTDR